MESVILRKGGGRVGVLSALIHFLKNLAQDEEWEVTVKRFKRSRSDSQNNALWGVAYEALKRETGNDPEDLHTYFCGEYFGWEVEQVMGHKRMKPKRTTTRNEEGKREVLPWDKFCEFYAYIQRRAAEVGVFVPDPDPAWRDAA